MVHTTHPNSLERKNDISTMWKIEYKISRTDYRENLNTTRELNTVTYVILDEHTQEHKR